MEPIDLNVALDAIIAELAKKFPTFKTVAAEDETRKELEVPALIVQFSSIEPEPDQDPENGQFPARVRVEARIVMGHRTPKVRREVIKAAAAIATFAHKNRFGVKWGAGVVVGCDPDEFSPIASTFDVWLIEWGHMACFGDDYFANDKETPTQIVTSWVPDIGLGNEDKYS